MCMSYGGIVCRGSGANHSQWNGAFCDYLDLQSAGLHAKRTSDEGSRNSIPSEGRNGGLEILDIEEVLKSTSSQSTGTSGSTSGSIVDSSKSSSKEESSFADYEGSSFVIEDDSSITSLESVESSDNSFLDSYMKHLLEPVGDVSDSEVELESDYGELFMDFQQNTLRDHWSAGRRVDTLVAPRRRVNFSSRIHVREYAVTVGSHTNSSGVCPLELSWEYVEREVKMREEEDESLSIEASYMIGGHVKIPAKSFHDSFDTICTKSNFHEQQSLASMMPNMTSFSAKKESSDIRRLSIKQRRERIAAVQGISVKQVKQMELKSVLDQVKDSINTLTF